MRMMDEERMDGVRAEFREQRRRNQQTGPHSPASHVHPESAAKHYRRARENLAAQHDVLVEDGRREHLALAPHSLPMLWSGAPTLSHFNTSNEHVLLDNARVGEDRVEKIGAG